MYSTQGGSFTSFVLLGYSSPIFPLKHGTTVFQLDKRGIFDNVFRNFTMQVYSYKVTEK